MVVTAASHHGGNLRMRAFLYSCTSTAVETMRGVLERPHARLSVQYDHCVHQRDLDSLHTTRGRNGLAAGPG